jgi:hypothetical protein
MMNSKLIQSAGSIFLAAIALPCIFIPDEVSKNVILAENEYVLLMVQILGGLLFGFAVVNWMSRTVIMGGIYGKAIYMGNLAQFMVGGLALLKWNVKNGFPAGILLVILIGYMIFLVLYLMVFFRSPKIAAEK